MISLLHKLLSQLFPSIAWTIVILILLSLPGNMLPNENNLSIPNLDKIVHFFLFGGFVFLWSYYFAYKTSAKKSSRYIFLIIMLISCLYGTAMEFVQKYFIPNRDFDVYDILADIVGSTAGYLIVWLTINTNTPDTML